jgi:hypothetical protein
MTEIIGEERIISHEILEEEDCPICGIKEKGSQHRVTICQEAVKLSNPDRVFKNVLLMMQKCERCGSESVGAYETNWNKQYFAERKEAERVAEKIRIENPEYVEVKVLQDNSIAILLDLMFTRAICLGANESQAYTTRYCFENREKATELFQTLESEDDELTGYTARRPEWHNEN